MRILVALLCAFYFAGCSQKAAFLDPKQIKQAGASTNDVLTWDGSEWAPAAAGGGASGGGIISGYETNSNTGTFYQPPDQDITSGSTTGLDDWRMPTTCTAQNLRAGVGSAPGSGKQWTVQVRAEGTSTGVTCIISGTSKECSDTSNTGVITADDIVYVLFAQGSGPGATGSSFFAFECVP